LVRKSQRGQPGCPEFGPENSVGNHPGREGVGKVGRAASKHARQEENSLKCNNTSFRVASDLPRDRASAVPELVMEKKRREEMAP